MKKYSIVIFDLDDTLSNERKNIMYAFECMKKYRNESFSEEEFLKFNKIDKKFWKDRSEGKIYEPDNFGSLEEKILWIRAQRFLIYYDNKISLEEAKKLNNIYLESLKEVVEGMEGAKEVVEYLYNKNYKLVVATNGPLLAVKSKLNKIGIDEYISTIFSSEECGSMKPRKEFFDNLLVKIGSNKKDEMIIIGDELLKDVKGGIINNIDTCWFNFREEENLEEYIPTYEIKKLIEIKNIL